MCGIAGIWNLDGRPFDRGALEQMTRALAHRGPDGEGFYLDGQESLGLGHRRLAILDLSETGRQPMSLGSGRCWITFNGEIYNFIELRRELESLGYRFRSESDTEVILAAYDRWGPECQMRFNGMWAFALWDISRRELFLSRDRFGIKPLHYIFQPGRLFAFASELKAFKALKLLPQRISDSALRAVLTNCFSLEGTRQTLHEGVERLPGGHYAIVNDRGMHVSRWWHTLDHLVSVPASFDKQVEEFTGLFMDSCRLRMRSDVPIGTGLSGGLDSSSVIAAVARLGRTSGDRIARDWQHPFVATFPGTPLDEREYARAVVEGLGIEGHYLPIDPEASVSQLDRILRDFEEIYLALPDAAWWLYRGMRGHGVCVTLDGHGADELLGGYPELVEEALVDSVRWWGPSSRSLDLVRILQGMVPGAATRTDAVARLRNALLNRQPWSLLRRARSALRRCAVRAHLTVSRPELGWIREPLHLETGESVDERRELARMSRFEAQLYRGFHFTTLPTILRNFDRLSMAHGVEVRMPFMDWRLVTYTFSLPSESKLGNGFTKRIVREGMRPLLPEAVRARRTKIGFNSPMVEWFQGPLRPLLQNLASDPSFLDNPIWDGRRIAEFIQLRLTANRWEWRDIVRVWPFLHAHWYTRAFLGGSKALASAE